MPDPATIATWRFEQITPLLDDRLSRADKRRYLRDRARDAVDWPGRTTPRPIPRATLLRWLARYRRGGLEDLRPRERHRTRTDRSELISHALALLTEEPARSLAQLLHYLALQFPDTPLSRSTLQRELTRHPAYAGIVRQRSGYGRRLRDRYETSRSHECWQLDGKGPFPVPFTDGTRRRVHILSVLDDYSRYVLAAVTSPTESTPGTVRALRQAIARFGLPDRMQFDRGSAFDSHPVRDGLALLGIHRNFVRPKNPEAGGKVEAYHRVLERWFVRELRHQEVHNDAHLQDLLTATIELLYNRHRHRILKQSPEQALAQRISQRRVGAEELARAFWARTNVKSHPKTGELALPNGQFRVTWRYAGKRVRVRYDPAEPRAVLLLGRDQELALEPMVVKPLFPIERPRGHGQLQKILDRWRGHQRPNALPGFGLPELFRELTPLVGHLVPDDDREARLIADFYRDVGPLDPAAFGQALATTQAALGSGRAIDVYLDHLRRLIRAAQPKSEQP